MLPTTNETAAGRPRITFAIPYYSNSGYLLEAIRSVQAQTVDDWDVIVVDDAGPEPIVGVIAELGDPRIRSVRNDVNLGLAANWNRCIQLASAALVTLLHADDRLAPGYAAAVLAAAERDPELAAIFTDATIIGTDGLGARSLPDAMKRLARRPAHDHDVQGDDGLASMLANNYVFCPTLCYRTASLVDHPFADRWRMVMDLDHTAQMLLHGLRLHGVRAPLYEYRRHDSNQTSSLTASAIRFEEELALYRQLATAARRIGWLRSARTADRRLMVRSHLALQALVDLAGRRFGAAKRKASLLVRDVRGHDVRDGDVRERGGRRGSTEPMDPGADRW